MIKEKVPYDELLPEVAFVSEAELERIWGIAKEDVSAAAEEMDSYEDAVLIPVLRSLLDRYYADAQNPDVDSIEVLRQKLQSRAEWVFAGYDAALEERLNVKNLDYEEGIVIVAFELYTPYEDIKEIAERVNACVDVLDGTNKTLEDYIAAGIYTKRCFIASLDFGISMSATMAYDLLQKVDCVKLVDLNGYVSLDPYEMENRIPALKKEDVEGDKQPEEEKTNPVMVSGRFTKPDKKGQEQIVSLDGNSVVGDKVSLKINKTRYTVKKGKTVKIKVSAAKNRKVTFKSNKKKVARVSAGGKVTGLKKGTAKITVKCGSVKKTVRVTVK